MNENTYSRSGVSIEKADQAKNLIKGIAAKTFNENVKSSIGSFGGCFKTPDGGILVSSSDGVGTKIILAQKAGIYNTVGVDLVNHCVNDILVMGAMPLYFLDYIGHSTLLPEQIASIVEGLANGCSENGLALIGGETAQMPDLYPEKAFDLVGFITGVVEEKKLITGKAISENDAVIGIASSGLHTNGYSLARSVLADRLNEKISEQTVLDLLLKTHLSYLKPVKTLLNKYDIHGMAHITGGGVEGNLVRVIPDHLDAVIEKESAPRPVIFDIISEYVAEEEMFKVFNMGFGMLLSLPKTSATDAITDIEASGFKAFIAGEIIQGSGKIILK
jgi:phosphoribosylformylglycinamidine cyclo-ligase